MELTMVAASRRLAVLVACMGLTSLALAQFPAKAPLTKKPTPPKTIAFLTDYQAALKQAKSTGLPLLVVAFGADGKVPTPLYDRDVVARSRAFVNVAMPAAVARANKVPVDPGEVLLLVSDASRFIYGLEADFSTAELLKRLNRAVERMRPQVLDRLNKETQAAAQKALADSYLRLDPSIAEVIPLLKYKNADVQTLVRANLLAREVEGADWALMNAMGSPDADLRTGAHPAAVAITKSSKVPAVKFWSEAAEEERTAELEKWREAVYGKMPPLNRAMLDFAFDNWGKQVDSGQCNMLAVKAMKHANAQPVRKDGDTWSYGQKLPRGETAIPGDIVMMEKARFSDGSATGEYHIQIVRRVMGKGKYEILEQNYDDRLTVANQFLDVSLLTQGTIDFFRPLEPVAKAKPKPKDKK
jgi:hypothetical protein